MEVSSHQMSLNIIVRSMELEDNIQPLGHHNKIVLWKGNIG